MQRCPLILLFITIVYLFIPHKVMAISCSSDTDNVCKSTTDRATVTNPVQPFSPTPPTQLSSSAGIQCEFDSSGGIKTAIGCLPYSPVVLVNSLVRFLIAVGSGVALLIMAVAAIQMTTQGSDPNSLKSARQRFVNAASGLVFIIFSVLILKIIGVDILQIPGFK